MGRMRQMSIERVDAVDQPATGHTWVIAKRAKATKKGENESTTPTSEELVKAAFEALQKDAELDVSEEVAVALSALAEAHGLEFKLEKDADDAEAADESTDDDESKDDETEDDDADASEDDDAEGDDEDDEDDDETSDDEAADDESDLAKRMATVERGLELILEKLDGGETKQPAKTEKQAAPARRRRTSKQAQGQDDLGNGEGESLTKSTGRVSYASVLAQ